MQNNCNNKLLRVSSPISVQKRVTVTYKMEVTPKDPEKIISLETPGDDYRKFFEDHIQSEEIENDDDIERNFSRLAAATREAVWTLLFTEPPIENHLEKAADLLEEHKADACFHSPYDYNDWIVRVRDKLLERGMLDFWRNNIVNRELGLCWARDSDFFDDIDDPAPIDFYNRGGCEAPFLGEKDFGGTGMRVDADAETDADVVADEAAAPSSMEYDSDASTLGSRNVPKTISEEDPEKDYEDMVKDTLARHPEDETRVCEVFDVVQKAIWHYLFDYKDELTNINYQRAARLLELYKKDACFYYPFKYNEWIPLLRDELFKRKGIHLTFWKDVILARKLGLCWYQDSDYFDDAEDTRAIEFYKSGDNLISKIS